MKQRILSLALALCLCLGLAPAALAAEENADTGEEQGPRFVTGSTEFDIGSFSVKNVGFGYTDFPGGTVELEITPQTRLNLWTLPKGGTWSSEISADIPEEDGSLSLHLSATEFERTWRNTDTISISWTLRAAVTTLDEDNAVYGTHTVTTTLDIGTEINGIEERTEVPISFTFTVTPPSIPEDTDPPAGAPYAVSQSRFDLGTFTTGPEDADSFSRSGSVSVDFTNTSDQTISFGNTDTSSSGGSSVTVPYGVYSMRVRGRHGPSGPGIVNRIEPGETVTATLYYNITDDSDGGLYQSAAEKRYGTFNTSVELPISIGDFTITNGVERISIPFIFTFEVVPGENTPEEPENPENTDPEESGPGNLTVSTDLVDFGTYWRDGLQDWPAAQDITITNTGASSVKIEDILYPDAFTLSRWPDQIIYPGESHTFTIQPEKYGNVMEAGNYDGTLTLVMADGASVSVELAFTLRDGISPEMASAELPAGFTADAPCLGVETVTHYQGESYPLYRFPVGTRIQAVDGTVIQRIFVPLQADYREPVDNSFTLPYVSEYIIEAVDADGNPVILAMDSVEAPQPEEPALPFTDVKEGDWYYDAVAYVYENGVMSGTSASAFQPAGQLSRAMVAQVLWNLAGTPAAGESAGFADVAAGTWYGDAVNWAAAQGIVTGYSASAFGPDDPVTREQLAVMLHRYAGSPAASGSLDGFADRDAAGSYAADALAWAVGEGLLSGKDGGRLDPTGTASRAELATILMRFEQ